MHYVSADSLWFCSNFSSVLIVMQVVAMGLCFGDDAIWCCVFVNNQTEACLDLKQHSDAVNSPSGPLTTPNNLKSCGCFYQKLAKVFGFRCSWELSDNKDRAAFSVGRLAKVFWFHLLSFLHQTQQLIPNAGGYSSLQDEFPAPAFILLSLDLFLFTELKIGH